MQESLYRFTEDRRAAYESMPVAMCVFQLLNNRCRLLIVSDGMCRLLGLTRARVIEEFSHTPSECVCPDDFSAATSADVYLLLHPEEEYQATYRLKGPDGSYFWALCRGRAEKLEDGSLLLFANYTDITDTETLRTQKAVEKIRQDSLVQDVLATTGTAIFWKDSERRFLGVNQAFLDYFGLPETSELLGKTDEEMGWDLDPQDYREDERAVLEDGAILHRVHRRCMARGKAREILTSKNPLYAEGRIVGFVGSFEDVTTEYGQKREIDRLNGELTQKIAEFEMLMDSTRVCIAKVHIDEEFTIEWCNDAMYRFLGYEKEEHDRLFGGKMRRYFAGGFEYEFHAMLDALERARAKNEPRFEIVVRMPIKQGFRWIKGVGTFTDYRGGKAESVYAVYTDVTEVVRTQERLAAAEKSAERASWLKDENERLKNIIDNVPSGISVYKDIPGRPPVMTVNRYLTDMLGVTNEEIAAGSTELIRRLVHPEDFSRVMADHTRLFCEDDSYEGVFRLFQRSTGEYIWVRILTRIFNPPQGGRVAYFSYTDINAIKRTEAALRESRLMYEEAVRSAKLILWDYDIEHHLIIMSGDEITAADCAKFGIPRVIPNVPGSMAKYIDKNDLPRMAAMYRAVDEGRDASCEVWYTTVPGREPRCERMTCTVVRNDQGRPVKAYCLGQNVTAEKKVEERYERELSFLKENSDYNLIAKGRSSLTRNEVLEYSPLGAHAYQPPELRSYDEAIAAYVGAVEESDRELVRECMSREYLIRRYQKGELHTDFQYRRPGPGQVPMWISTDIHTYMAPATGELECFAYTYDVTDKVLEKQIIERLSMLGFDVLGILYVNTGMCRYYRIKKLSKQAIYENLEDYESSVSADIERIVVPEQRDSVHEALLISVILENLQKKDLYPVSYSMRNSQGKLLQKLLQFSYLDREHGLIFFCKSDITQQYEHEHRQIEELKAAKLEADRANEAKSSFLSSMSHDLRTPLSGVISFTDLALREKDPDMKQSYLEKIRSSGGLLMDLVSDTLELSRIESGKMKLEPEAVNGYELGEAVFTALRPVAELKGIRMTVDLSRYPNETIWVDRLKAQKIMLNLLSNAIKYTPAGGTVTLKIEVIDPPCNGMTRRIIVTDNGIGMSDEFLPHLYEPFAQELRPEAEGTAGTGLGLAIVKRIVDLMQGRISVESRLGEGTSFAVELPISRTNEPALRRQTLTEDQRDVTGRRILLIEDNYLNTEIATILLRGKGLLVESAVNGSEGVKKFSDSASDYYDAVLMDLRMPVMDGYEAARAIRKLPRQDAASVPIIAMTADAFEENSRRAFEAGMNAYLTKPVDPERLLSSLREVIGGESHPVFSAYEGVPNNKS